MWLANVEKDASESRSVSELQVSGGLARRGGGVLLTSVGNSEASLSQCITCAMTWSLHARR